MLKNYTEFKKYVIRSMLNKSTNISCSLPGIYHIDFNTLCNDLYSQEPKLVAYVRSIQTNTTNYGDKIEYRFTIEYYDVKDVQLIHSRKEFRDILHKTVMNFNKKINLVFPAKYMDEFIQTADNIVKNPDYLLFFVNKVNINYSSNPKANYCFLEVNIGYVYNRAKCIKNKKLVELKSRYIANKISKYAKEDWRKAHYLMRYIVRNWNYDFSFSESSYTPYGAIINNDAVCMGFSLAIYEICRYLHIPCRYITGKRLNEGHAWNMIKIAGDWFYIDATDMISANSPYYNWGVTHFSDNRIIDSPYNDILRCNVSEEFIHQEMAKLNYD